MQDTHHLAHCKVAPFKWTSYFRDEETEAQKGRCDFLRVSQEVAGWGWCPARLTTAPREQVGTGSGERGSFPRAASGPRGTEVGQQGAHTEGAL